MGITREESLSKFGNESYTAWDLNGAIEDAKKKGIIDQGGNLISQPSSNSSIGSTFNSQPTINLTDTYNQLLDASGISGLENTVNSTESKINQMTSEAAAARSNVNENPWIGEASRIGRIAKIDTKLNEAIAPLQKDIANVTNQVGQKKTDISNQLNLKTQQYNIDVAANQQNLSNFNSLLSSGALVNATAQDIATLSQQTGLAAGFIQSAIAAAKKAANPLSVGTYTDANNNLVAYTMDSQGNLVNSNVIGRAKAAAGTGGSATAKKTELIKTLDTVLVSNRNSYGHIPPALYNEAMKSFVEDGLGTAADFEKQYSYLRDPNRQDPNTPTGYIIIKE